MRLQRRKFSLSYVTTRRTRSLLQYYALLYLMVSLYQDSTASQDVEDALGDHTAHFSLHNVRAVLRFRHWRTALLATSCSSYMSAMVSN